MKKTLIATSLLIALSVSLVGCSDSIEEQKRATTSIVQETPLLPVFNSGDIDQDIINFIVYVDENINDENMLNKINDIIESKGLYIAFSDEKDVEFGSAEFGLLIFTETMKAIAGKSERYIIKYADHTKEETLTFLKTKVRFDYDFVTNAEPSKTFWQYIEKHQPDWVQAYDEKLSAAEAKLMTHEDDTDNDDMMIERMFNYIENKTLNEILTGK